MENQDPKVLFQQLHKRAKALGITGAQLDTLGSVDYLKAPRYPRLKIGLAVVVVVLAVSLGICLKTGLPFSNEIFTHYYFELFDQDMDRELCVVEQSETLMEAFRPPVNCDFCKGVEEIKRVTNLSPEEFEEKYAYSGQGVIISDGQANWTAAKTFNFNFFKGIYQEGSPALDGSSKDCQFFPYKTNFETLADVFNMSDDRAQLKDGSKPWYIGWSNCDSSAANILREHYHRPYFLPKVSESSKTDWIFMGSPGYGAHMHIDNVGKHSWQAQITGHKRWILEPPPECYHQCKAHIEVVVKPGEIIVLDTNRWYHATLIEGKDMSICIGSEYD